jgi:hypothetical protein
VQHTFFLNWVSTIGIALLLVFIADLVHRLRSFERRILEEFEKLSIPLALADDDLFQVYRRVASAMTQVAEHEDSLFRELAFLRLGGIAGEVEELGQGTITFSGTETWHAAYQKLLLTLKVQSYYSVAWVRTTGYWSDPPGQQSMQLNFDLVQRGFHIQRIHILPEQLWPAGDLQPAREVRVWLEKQSQRGIVVHVARERDLADEPELLRDFAIYGDRAAAVQELDERSRTSRFVLSFDRRATRQALDRWERLSLYATSLENLVDRKGRTCVG